MQSKLVLTPAEIVEYMAEVWPEVDNYFEDAIQWIKPESARLVKRVGANDLRPGGTVSGPFLMHLADAGGYTMVLARVGRQALAVTSSLSINFLRRPTGPYIAADIDLERLGRSLAVMSVKMCSVETQAATKSQAPEAIATVTYSLALTDS